MHTWLLESGVRARYAMMKQNMGLSVVQEIIGEEVFLSGPHQSDINLKSKASFGYYNPVFLNKLNVHLELLYKDPTFVRSAQAFYDKEFRNYFRVYYLSYTMATQDSKTRERYIELIQNAEELDPYDYRNNPSIWPSFIFLWNRDRNIFSGQQARQW